MAHLLRSKPRLSCALFLGGLAINANALTVINTGSSIEVYQSELEQLKISQLHSNIRQANQLLYWTQDTSDEQTSINCRLTDVKTPYLSTANNSFETCIIDNFNVTPFRSF